MTYDDLVKNEYIAYLIEEGGMCVGITERGIELIPFTDKNVFTMATMTKEEGIELLRLLRLSGGITGLGNAYVTSHAWYPG